MEKYNSKIVGQSLVEILVAVSIGAILIGAAVVAIIPITRSNVETRTVQVANALTQEYLDNLRAIAEANWQSIYSPPAPTKGPSSQFHLIVSGTTFALAAGSTSTISEAKTFTRYFSIENVNRDLCGIGNVSVNSTTACTAGPGTVGVSDDPSTQKITATVNWDSRSLTRSQYLTRSRNKIFDQTDWSGGPGQEGPITSENNRFATSTGSDYGGYMGSTVIQGLVTTSSEISGTNIDPVYRYAWNDIVGWLDFYYTGNVTVLATQITGYVSSSVGYIALDCATSPIGNICSNSNFQVLNNASNGDLSGWAWNDAIGWISFDSATAGSSYDYKVRVNPTGRFAGWAWNDIVGWFSFNCSDVNICGTSEYKVKTSWLPGGGPLIATLTSSIFDTQATSGVALNTIMWQGTQPLGTVVKFHLSSSNSASGPWNYIGPDGSSNTYYTPAGPSLPLQINPQYHNNQRYFRYKIFLYSDADGTVTPQVDDVIINWSP